MLDIHTYTLICIPQRNLAPFFFVFLLSGTQHIALDHMMNQSKISQLPRLLLQASWHAFSYFFLTPFNSWEQLFIIGFQPQRSRNQSLWLLRMNSIKRPENVTAWFIPYNKWIFNTCSSLANMSEQLNQDITKEHHSSSITYHPDMHI